MPTLWAFKSVYTAHIHSHICTYSLKPYTNKYTYTDAHTYYSQTHLYTDTCTRLYKYMCVFPLT